MRALFSPEMLRAGAVKGLRTVPCPGRALLAKPLHTYLCASLLQHDGDHLWELPGLPGQHSVGLLDALKAGQQVGCLESHLLVGHLQLIHLPLHLPPHVADGQLLALPLLLHLLHQALLQQLLLLFPFVQLQQRV